MIQNWKQFYVENVIVETYKSCIYTKFEYHTIDKEKGITNLIGLQ